MYAQKDNYEYYAHYYGLRKKMEQRMRQNVLNPVEEEKQECLMPMWRPNGTMNTRTVQSKMLMVSVSRD